MEILHDENLKMLGSSEEHILNVIDFDNPWIWIIRSKYLRYCSDLVYAVVIEYCSSCTVINYV